MCYLFLCKLYSFKKYKIILWNYFIEFLNNTFCQIIIVMTYLHTELWLVFILAFIFIVKSSHFMLTTAKFKVAEMRHFNYEEPKPETQPKPESQPKTLTFFFFFLLHYKHSYFLLEMQIFIPRLFHVICALSCVSNNYTLLIYIFPLSSPAIVSQCCSVCSMQSLQWQTL